MTKVELRLGEKNLRQHVGLQSSHGRGAPRIIPLPIGSRTYDNLTHCASASATDSATFIFVIFYIYFWRRKLTCPMMPIMSAIQKTDEANHRRVSGPQHILWQRKLLCHGISENTMCQPNMEPSPPRRQSSTHAWHQACDSTSEWEGHEQACRLR